MEPTAIDPLTEADVRIQARAWLACVRQRWQGGHMVQLARVLAEDLVQIQGLVIDLDQAVVQRILWQVNLRPVGLRQLLATLVEAGLLVQLQPGDGVNWGTYRLELPRCPTVRPTA